MAPVSWQDEKDEGLRTVRGILTGVLCGTLAWIVIMAILYSLYVWYGVQT